MLGLTAAEAETLRHASLLHDVGKIAVPDAILTKPGKLTDEEWVVMRRHAEAGAHILSGSSAPIMRMAEEIALTHHERWDGGGYPQGLSGERSRSWGASARCATSSTRCSRRGPTRSPGRCRMRSTSCAASAAGTSTPRSSTPS